MERRIPLLCFAEQAGQSLLGSAVLPFMMKQLFFESQYRKNSNRVTLTWMPALAPISTVSDTPTCMRETSLCGRSDFSFFSHEEFLSFLTTPGFG